MCFINPDLSVEYWSIKEAGGWEDKRVNRRGVKNSGKIEIEKREKFLLPGKLKKIN